MLPTVDHEGDAARSRRMGTLAAAIAGVFLLGLGGLWLSGRSASPAATARTAAPIQAAAPRAGEPSFVPPHALAVAPGREELSQSEAYYERRVREGDSDAEAHAGLARVRLQLGRGTEAIASFQLATQAATDRWDYWFQLAHAQCLLSRWDECIGSLRKARDLAPDEHALSHNLGVAFHRRGLDAAAVEEYQRAVALRPTEARSHLGLGVSRDRLGQTPEAVEAYQEYLSLLPEAPGADKIRARIAELSAEPR